MLLIAQPVANDGKGPLDIAWIMFFRPWFNDIQVQGSATIGGEFIHQGTSAGFFGAAPVPQRPSMANTTGATVEALEAEVNKLRQSCATMAYSHRRWPRLAANVLI
jgi:hypothetical protein